MCFLIQKFRLVFRLFHLVSILSLISSHLCRKKSGGRKPRATLRAPCCLQLCVSYFLSHSMPSTHSFLLSKKHRMASPRVITFSAFWLRSSVVSVLISLISDCKTLSCF